MMMHFDRRGLLSQFMATGLASGVAPFFTAYAAAKTERWAFVGGVAVHWEPLEILTGSMLVVAGQLNGRSVRALLDSGSGATAISPALAAELGISSNDLRTVRGLTGTATVRLAKDVEVGFGSVTRRLPLAIIADLSASDRALGRTIDVILGADMFAGNCIALDFANRRFTVVPSGHFSPSPGWTSVPLGRGDRQVLLIQATIAGREPVPLMFDLGSTTALTLSQAYVEKHGLTAGKPVSTAALGGVEGIQIVNAFTTERVAIAGLAVSDVPMICPPLSGPETMIVWTTKGTTDAIQKAQAGRDHREAA